MNVRLPDVPRGIRFGKSLGLLLGVVLAALIAVPGFYWAESLSDSDLRESAAEWGQPIEAAITDRGALTTLYGEDYEVVMRIVTVKLSDTEYMFVSMAEEASNAATATVWRNSRTGQLYVRGDLNRFGYDTPIQAGDYTLLMAVIVLVALGVLVVSFALGAEAAENYKYRNA